MVLETPAKSMGERPAGFLSPGLSFLSPHWRNAGAGGDDSLSTPALRRWSAKAPSGSPAPVGLSATMMFGVGTIAGAGIKVVQGLLSPVAGLAALPPAPRGIGFREYMLAEASSRFDPWKDRQQPTELYEVEERGDIPPFMRVPLKLELTLTVGFLACFDSFLFNYTLLPLRCISDIWWCTISFVRGRKAFDTFPEDIARMMLMFLAVVALNSVDISFLYHYIRGQMSSYIKLYVIYNVLEVFDRLFCSLGQDVFDGMLRLSQMGGLKRPNRKGDALGVPKKFNSLFYIPLSMAYVVGHSTVLLIQVVVLNVAINSNNNALITLLVANNFTELKSHVFKKLDEASLLQVMTYMYTHTVPCKCSHSRRPGFWF